MTKIYVDANRFLNFYRAADQGIDIFFGELQRLKNNLVLTQQTVTEFRRNRVGTLRSLRKSVIGGCVPNTSIMRWLSEQEDVTDLPKTSRKKARKVLRRLEEFIDDEEKDPVARNLRALDEDTTVMNLKLTNQALDKAFRRKLLGNPPRSDKKYTVGDEVVWELLLGNLDEDLIIVTSDRAFKDNLSWLREEYQRRTGATLLCVVETISAAVKGIGQKPSRKLVEEEKKLAKYEWAKEGIGRHAAALWERVDALIGDYAEEVEMETGECISDDAHIIPIMGKLITLIRRRCDEVQTDIREDAGMDPGESV